MREKTCTGCGKTKPLTDFYRQKGCKHGRAAACKVCRSKYKHEWYLEHREQQLEYAKQYVEDHKEYYQKKFKKYRKTHKSKFAQYQRNYRHRILIKVLEHDPKLGAEVIAALIKVPVKEVQLALNKIKKIL